MKSLKKLHHHRRVDDVVEYRPEKICELVWSRWVDVVVSMWIHEDLRHQMILQSELEKSQLIEELQWIYCRH